MKFYYFLLVLVPVLVFGQNYEYPDTLYMKSGVEIPCLIRDINIDGQYLNLSYQNENNTSVYFKRLDKIFLEGHDIIYIADKGFQKDINIIKKFLTNRVKETKLTKKEKENNSIIGIGVIFHNLWQDLFYDRYIPTVFIPINVNKKFKIEPEFGYYKDTDKNENWERTDTRLRIGIGLFGKNTKVKTTLYYGIRLGYISSKNIHKTKSYFGNNSSKENKTTRFFFGPAVGGEYFFGSRFSLGGEAGFRYTSINTEEGDDYYGYDNNGNITGTEVNIFLRFYF